MTDRCRAISFPNVRDFIPLRDEVLRQLFFECHLEERAIADLTWRQAQLLHVPLTVRRTLDALGDVERSLRPRCGWLDAPVIRFLSPSTDPIVRLNTIRRLLKRATRPASPSARSLPDVSR